MTDPRFSSNWINQYKDPFAALGLSVAADDNRVLKRYRSVVKLLHPDRFVGGDPHQKANATQFLSRLVNPAYKKLKQHRGRAESLAELRFQVRQNMDTLAPESEFAQKLLRTPIARVETVYEQAIAKLVENQYSPLDKFENVTTTLAELNLIYLRLKMKEPIILEKRVGIVPLDQAQAIEIKTIPVNPEAKTLSYAQRHYLRAEEYLKKGSLQMAVKELKDAIKLESDQSDYHALLAKAYILQKFPGAAKPYCRRALSLDPSHVLALRCAKILKIDCLLPEVPVAKSRAASYNSSSSRRKMGDSNKASTGLFNLFARRA
ncbi:MAG: molecular chaperone DnaJ [Cyanobacteria bacterium P01_F01_bin.150]